MLKTELIMLIALATYISGCAVHHRSKATGRETLIGLGRLKMQTQTLNEGVDLVKTESSSFGLLIEIGAGGPGMSLGYARMQRSFLLRGSNLGDRHIEHSWHSPFKSIASKPDSTASVIMTGHAVAGMSARYGRINKSVTLGIQDRACTEVYDDHLAFSLTSDKKKWPYRELFNAEIKMVQTNKHIE